MLYEVITLHNVSKSNSTIPASQSPHTNLRGANLATPTGQATNQAQQGNQPRNTNLGAPHSNLNQGAPLFTPGQSTSYTPFNGATQLTSQKRGVLLGTARIIVEDPHGRQVEARALIDNCSQPSFISRNNFV